MVSDRVETGLWTVGAVLGALWLVLVGLLVAGYVAGAHPTPDPGPKIDHSEPPNEVVVDAFRQLRTRDHTAELWFFDRNRTTGTTTGGIIYRVHLERSERRYRMVSWGTTTFATERGVVTSKRSPDYVIFGNDNFYVWQQNPENGRWERRRGSPYDSVDDYVVSEVDDAFVDASGTVVADNESALVVRVTNPEALARIGGIGYYERNASATVAVTKGENPHVERITLRNRTAGIVETTYVNNVGTATAPRPEPAPPVTVTETVVRTVRGLRELFG